MEENNKLFDLICIGAGSGGLAASREAAKLGATVALIEEKKVGGTCLQEGCIPKKIMYNASLLQHQTEYDLFNHGIRTSDIEIDWPTLCKQRDLYIINVTSKLLKRINDDNITLIQARGYFIDNNKIQLFYPDGTTKIIIGRNIIISTGGESNPIPQSIEGAELGISSDQFFTLKKQPKNVLIVGCGYIGTEFGNILHNLGSKVSIILKDLLPLNNKADSFIRNKLFENMLKTGIDLYNKSEVVTITKNHDSSLKVIINQAEYELKELDNIDCVIWCHGRKSKIKEIGLENTNVEIKDGYITVDQKCRTNCENIYAIGDVLSTPNFTPVAIFQGRMIARYLFSNEHIIHLPYNIPSAVYSYPPAASCGYTMENAQKILGKENIEVVEREFLPLYSAISGSQYTTSFRMIFNKYNEELIGIHLIGFHADEIIQGFSVAMSKQVTKSDLRRNVCIHPTLAEELLIS
jgi:glutathione reductase (NADPH)